MDIYGYLCSSYILHSLQSIMLKSNNGIPKKNNKYVWMKIEKYYWISVSFVGKNIKHNKWIYFHYFNDYT